MPMVVTDKLGFWFLSFGLNLTIRLNGLDEGLLKCFITFIYCYSLGREWADPGGTAIPGQPVAKAEQAPDTSPISKNQFNIVDPRWGSYQILS